MDRKLNRRKREVESERTTSQDVHSVNFIKSYHKCDLLRAHSDEIKAAKFQHEVNINEQIKRILWMTSVRTDAGADFECHCLLLFLIGYSKPKLWSSEEPKWRLGFGPDFLSPQKQAIHWIGLWCALFGVERWWRGGCLGIWSSFLESLKLNKHQSDNFNLFLALSRAPPRHCLLKVPMALFPVPFLFLYIPARCVFGPLPSHSWWWAFCFFEGELQRETANLRFSSTVWIVHKKPELSAAGSQQR